ncbi:hypothetical protein [Hamadaea tsunoensis]|uniref:hypothetical protein n=1 Tax=Hamadaea tsunoensis TaxID=53368 RepID=UPI0004293A94|nr:hypothetical protein [Hamadaea tsunoensis]
MPSDRLVHPLSYVRYERNWTLQDLVDVIAQRVGNMAAHREKAWRWENWGVTPDADAQLALAAELGVDPKLVASLGWPGWLPIGEGANVQAPWSLDGAVGLLDSTAGTALVDRRAFMVLGTGVASILADQWKTIEAPQLTSVLRGGRIDETLVACFEQRLPALRQMDFSLGGGSVRGLVDAELRLVTDLLASGSYTESLGRRLLQVAAELGRIAGWASFDVGFHSAAERYWVAALHAAHTANDRGLGANILKCMSLQRVDANLTGEALALARAARDGARDAPARVRAMLTVRQARTHAVRGEAVECERLLAEAETAMVKADRQPAPAWANYFDQAEYCAQVAACYLLLRRWRLANRWLGETLMLQPADRSRDRATYYIWQADAVLNLGDVEHACALVQNAVPDVASARSIRNRQRLDDTHRRLKKTRHSSTAALDDQVRALIR